MRRCGIVLLLLAAGCGGVSRGELAEAIATAAGSEKPPAYVQDGAWALMRGIYADREHAPRWVNADKPSAEARALVDAVVGSEAQGLRLGEYDLSGLQAALERAYGDGDGKGGPEALAELDLRFTNLYLTYGRDLLAGRLDPARVDGGWYIRTRRAAVDSTLRSAARGDSLEESLLALAPGQPDYEVLVGELRRYRGVESAGGWPAVRGPIASGVSGDEVVALRTRLTLSGDLDSAAAASPRFDAPLAQAVERFRARHGLVAGGGVDREAVAALNVPVARRIRQLELNLERLRWLPGEFGERYVMVNVPDFHLYAFEGGKQVLDMRVVVGGEYDQETPVFADTMSYVEFRPYWNVPRSIMVDEIAPRAREGDEFLRANDYEVVPATGKGDPVDPGSVDWDDAGAEDFPYRVRQGPGPGNALGLVKFMFPNRFDIYMHDTPAAHLFHEHRRAFSHGCIRLEHPDRFAEYVLDGLPESEPDRIRELMQGDEMRQVRVKRTLPVYILYLTAFARDGRVQYRDDLYGTDRRALARMGKPASPAVVAALRETLSELMKG